MPLPNWLKARNPNYSPSISVSLISVFAAITTIFTVLIVIPAPSTSGFINIGDIGVMLAGLLFGPVIGGLAGGIGSAVADLILGFGFFSPWTLIIKGLEGFLVGLISKRENSYLDIIACFLIAGPWMVAGYFMVETVFFGIGAAITELLGNTIQFVVGGAVSIPLAAVVRNALPQMGLNQNLIKKYPKNNFLLKL